MAKNTSVALGDHFEKFVAAQVKTGRYASASEVLRDGLRLLETEQGHRAALVQALIDGENSGPARPLNREKFFRDAHRRSDQAKRSAPKAKAGR